MLFCSGYSKVKEILIKTNYVNLITIKSVYKEKIKIVLENIYTHTHNMSIEINN